MEKSCYDVLQVDEHADIWDIQEAYMKLEKSESNRTELFDAYLLALELCTYKPFFSQPCMNVDEKMKERNESN